MTKINPYQNWYPKLRKSWSNGFQWYNRSSLLSQENNSRHKKRAPERHVHFYYSNPLYDFGNTEIGSVHICQVHILNQSKIIDATIVNYNGYNFSQHMPNWPIVELNFGKKWLEIHNTGFKAWIRTLITLVK